MARRYLHFLLLMCVLLAFKAIYPLFSRSASLDTQILRLTGNAETQMAAGGKIDFTTASEADLQLVPGIADELSAELIEKRLEVIRRSHKLSPEKRHTALEIVHGVGAKKAAKFGEYLDCR